MERKAHKWIPDTGDILAQVLRSAPENRLALMTKIAAQAMGCSRCCIILEGSNGRKDKSLNLVAGYPAESHGTGPILPQYGEKELKSFLKNATIEFISNPKRDKRVAYMKSLSETWDIEAMLRVPLYSPDTPSFGLLAFDWTTSDITRIEKETTKEGGREKKFGEWIASGVNKIAKVFVAIIQDNQQRTEEIEDKEKRARAGFMAEQSLSVEDRFRNPFTTLKAWALKLVQRISKLRDKFPEDEDLEKCLQYAINLKNEIDEFALEAFDVILTTKFKPENLNFRTQNIAGFLKELTDEFSSRKKESQRPILVQLDCKTLGTNGSLKFDSQYLKESLSHILENAAAAQAGTIQIKASMRSMNGNGGSQIVITIANDGKKMSNVQARQIFDTFAATNDLQPRALSIVKSVIEAHGGKIMLREEPRTTFIIYLPIHK